MSERVAVFIDGRNFYHSTKNLEAGGYKVSFQEIVSELVEDRELVIVFYYNALLDKNHNLEKYNIHNKFLDILRKIPKFKVVLCDVKKILNRNRSFRYDIKGDDVQLAHDLLMGAVDNLYDIAIIVSGDADFIPVVKTIRGRFKKEVVNAYFRRTSSYRLRKSCDFSINLYKVIIRLNEKENKKRQCHPKMTPREY